jgi:CRISPR associated protein Cas1
LERKVASLASTRLESKGQSEFGDSFRVNLDPRAEWRLGYDPTIDIMHEGNDGSSKFIFDLMEPERPKVDRAVLDFVGRTYSTQRTLSFVAMGFAGLTRKLRGWWWQGFRHRNPGPVRPQAAIALRSAACAEREDKAHPRPS